MLPAPDAGELNLADLAKVLMNPDTTTPANMIDALYYVSDVSTLDNVEDLQFKVAKAGMRIERDPAPSPLDFVLDVWNADPELIRSHHAEALAQSQQVFNYHAGLRGGPREFPAISDETRLAIETKFDDWFAEHNRGRGCRLIVIRQPDIVWLVIRHGNLMRREACHQDDGAAGSAYYRPQLHDVLVYDESNDEIGVHVQGKRAGKLGTSGNRSEFSVLAALVVILRSGCVGWA